MCYLSFEPDIIKIARSNSQEDSSGHKPSVAHLRVFDSITYFHIPDEKRKKLDDKFEKCIIVTYSKRFKVYKIYNPITKKLVIIRDVKFDKKKKA